MREVTPHIVYDAPFGVEVDREGEVQFMADVMSDTQGGMQNDSTK